MNDKVLFTNFSHLKIEVVKFRLNILISSKQEPNRLVD